jgi:hypothetical protein
VATTKSCTTFLKVSPVVTKDWISPVVFPAALVRAVRVVEKTLVTAKIAVLNITATKRTYSESSLRFMGPSLEFLDCS